jgi:hypothetical protein
MEVRVCLMLQSLSPWGNNPHYPLNRRLGGHQRWCGCCGERKILSLQESNPTLSSSKLTYYTELFWLPILTNRDKNK